MLSAWPRRWIWITRNSPITVQLFPYDDTPNRGGIYRAWVTQADACAGSKVKGKFEPPEITIRQFRDRSVNGVQGAGEPDITGWPVDVTDPSGVMNTIYTPMTIIAADAGAYTFVESLAKSFIQTVSILDGTIVSLHPNADPTVIVNLRLGDPAAYIMVDGSLVSVQDLINEAIDVWQSTDARWQNTIKSTLDKLNNNNYGPCVYYVVPFSNAFAVCGHP